MHEFWWPMGINQAMDVYFICLTNPGTDYYYAEVIEGVNALVHQAMTLQHRICTYGSTPTTAGWIGSPVQSPGI